MIRRGLAVAYVVVVASTATIGFTTETTGAILLAVVLALPTGVPGLIGYYLAYGLLAQLSGANPDHVSGSCSSGGGCVSSGDPASWFTVTTEVVGILALTIAALVNVAVAESLLRGRRATSDRTRSGA
jgi:hypothetical protein